jgi:hypothetical protein
MPLSCAGGFFGVLWGGEGRAVPSFPGILWGGDGIFLFPSPVVGNGGVALDGNAVPLVPIGEGGPSHDGEVYAGLEADGGASLDGEVLPGLIAGDGGAALDGSVSIFAYLGPGGPLLDGEVIPGLEVDGGASLDGEAVPLVPVGDGGAAFDGEILIGLDVGDGGAELDGEILDDLVGDGGAELDGEILAGLDVGDGGPGLDGEVEPSGGSITPGDTCATAGEIPLGEEFEGTLPFAETDWFYFPALGGTEYHVTFTVISSSGFQLCWVKGGVCDFPANDYLFLNMTSCGSFTPGSNQTVFIQVTPGFGDLDYKVKVETGPCP